MNTKTLTWLLLLLLAVLLPLRGNALINGRSIHLNKSQDIIVIKNHIWVFDESGRIEVYTANGTKVSVASLSDIRAQLITAAGNDVVAQVGTKIQRWSSQDSTWHIVGKLSADAFALIITSKQLVFAITDKGILDVASGKNYLPDKSPNDQLDTIENLGKSSACFLDKEDNIWLGFGYGEWGGNIFAFDTQRGKFAALKFNSFRINLHPIKSFFQLNSGVGTSSGLQHMSNSGAITEFKNQSAQLIYDSWHDRDTSATKQPFFSNATPYIGPAVYEPGSNNLYVYSNLGVYKGQYGTDLSRFTAWEKVFQPKLHWRNGQPDAVGSPMNMLKMLSLGNGKLVLLTQNDGVGLWDGKTFNLLL